jgi:hypothetical protein
MNEYTGYIYLGGAEMLAGYQVGWEYPSEWVAPEQSETTEHLAELLPSEFEGIYTVFPTPQAPRPKK